MGAFEQPLLALNLPCERIGAPEENLSLRGQCQNLTLWNFEKSSYSFLPPPKRRGHLIAAPSTPDPRNAVPRAPARPPARSHAAVLCGGSSINLTRARPPAAPLARVPVTLSITSFRSNAAGLMR
jgi:hypothetical protein